MSSQTINNNTDYTTISNGYVELHICIAINEICCPLENTLMPYVSTKQDSKLGSSTNTYELIRYISSLQEGQLIKQIIRPTTLSMIISIYEQNNSYMSLISKYISPHIKRI
jgi:hypothetical protein